MHGKFELLSLPKKLKNHVVPVAVKEVPQLVLYEKPKIDVQLLTLKEAKRLYEELKEFFG